MPTTSECASPKSPLAGDAKRIPKMPMRKEGTHKWVCSPLICIALSSLPRARMLIATHLVSPMRLAKASARSTMNFLMCSFTNHNLLLPRLSLSNTSLCSSKYSDTMDICYNTWKWVRGNKFGYGVITYFPMFPLPVSLLLWRDLGTPIKLLEPT
jgi:hypothetical protein